jgi:hypothetical protein
MLEIFTARLIQNTPSPFAHAGRLLRPSLLYLPRVFSLIRLSAGRFPLATKLGTPIANHCANAKRQPPGRVMKTTGDIS